MNDDPQKPLTIAFTGNLTIARAEWEQLVRQTFVANPSPATLPQSQSLKVADGEEKLPRPAFSVMETAKMLGISQPTCLNKPGGGLSTVGQQILAALLTRKQLAERWTCCSHTIARRKDLHPIRLGPRLVRYSLDEIQTIEATAKC
jgi:hypothetical protein